MTLRRCSAALALSFAVLLGACGNESDMDPSSMLLRAASQAATARLAARSPTAPPPTDLQLRAALQAEGKPILRMQSMANGSVAFLAPVASNQGVQTWSTNERLLLSSRDGVILATRGFGSDIMAATVPSLAQIARGSGSHTRLHVYLDGADQPRKFTMTCTVSTVGAETITVLGLRYATRHIRETCDGKAGSGANDYWFQGGTLRQSQQFLVPGQSGLILQSIVD